MPFNPAGQIGIARSYDLSRRLSCRQSLWIQLKPFVFPSRFLSQVLPLNEGQELPGRSIPYCSLSKQRLLQREGLAVVDTDAAVSILPALVVGSRSVRIVVEDDSPTVVLAGVLSQVARRPVREVDSTDIIVLEDAVDHFAP